MQKLDKKLLIKIIMLVIFLIVMTLATIFAIPLIKLLITVDGRLKIQNFVEGYGAFGAIIFVGFQIIQVVIAFIPGEPFEIIGGVLFGAFGGLLLCMIGVLLGAIAVYYLVKWIGQPLVSLIIDDKKIRKLKILNDTKKLETLVFILFLIPGTPKDMLTYFVPLTKIKPVKYFLYATIARIPSIISSTLVGSSLGKGKWALSILIFSATAIIGLVGILYNDRFIKKEKNIK